MPPIPPKPELRATLKPILAAIPPSTQLAASNSISNHLLNSLTYQSASTILAYAALPAELSLDPLILEALADNKRICIPQINWEDKSMRPAQIHNLDSDLQTGRYGVRTPINGCPLVETHELDLILIPGLAFDRQGNRLGRGAGFYDRLISTLDRTDKRPSLVGVCYQCQIVDRVPTEPHDYPMDRVITENGFL